MELKQNETYPLSSDDIYKLLGHTKIVKYPSLATVTNIFDCFDKQNRFILFFETTSQSSGHWECCWYDKPHNTIHFFDSYGLAPDKAEGFLSLRTRIQLKETKPLLTALLNKAQDEGYQCVYSTTKYQSMVGDINTCGRHCCVRLAHKNMNEDEYFQFMTQQ